MAESSFMLNWKFLLLQNTVPLLTPVMVMVNANLMLERANVIKDSMDQIVAAVMLKLAMVLESVWMMVNANVIQDIWEAIVKKWKLQKVAFYVFSSSLNPSNIKGESVLSATP